MGAVTTWCVPLVRQSSVGSAWEPGNHMDLAGGCVCVHVWEHVYVCVYGCGSVCVWCTCVLVWVHVCMWLCVCMIIIDHLTHTHTHTGINVTVLMKRTPRQPVMRRR